MECLLPQPIHGVVWPDKDDKYLQVLSKIGVTMSFPSLPTQAHFSTDCFYIVLVSLNYQWKGREFGIGPENDSSNKCNGRS